MDIQGAIKSSIETEKSAMVFYQIGAKQMKNPDAKRLFEILAKEEREHAGLFFKVYKGNDIPSLEDFLNAAPDSHSVWVTSINSLVEKDFTEKKALELAMQREKELEASLLKTASEIEDSNVRAVFEINAKETNKHYQTIESEYARVMRMPHETDIDTFVRE